VESTLPNSIAVSASATQRKISLRPRMTTRMTSRLATSNAMFTKLMTVSHAVQPVGPTCCGSQSAAPTAIATMATTVASTHSTPIPMRRETSRVAIGGRTRASSTAATKVSTAKPKIHARKIHAMVWLEPMTLASRSSAPGKASR
jgi:hypothetical protein